MTAKKWFTITMLGLLAVLLLLGGITLVVDPFFHFHKPVEGLAYEMSVEVQRYINDGISKHFEYDALLTGTSMMENARCSTFDELFDAKSVKLPYEGSSLNETEETIRRAIEANDELRIVFRTLDFFSMIRGKDENSYSEDSYPRYLYDNNPFNDTSYVFNKTVLLKNTLPALLRTVRGESMTDFDRYSLMSAELFGMAEPSEYAPPNENSAPTSQELLANMEANILQNVRGLIEENPQIDFYLIFPPYSVLHWNDLRRDGLVDGQLDIEQAAAELLIDLENVHLFAFYDCPEIVGNLADYKDSGHYGADIMDIMFTYMAKGEKRITPENCEETFRRARQLYKTGDLAAMVQYNMGA